MKHEIPALTVACAGAFGDECIILPLFYDYFKQTGRYATVVVSAQYASIFNGVSYVNVIVSDSKYNRNDEANRMEFVQFAKTHAEGNILFLNPIEDTARKTDSFLKEMWRIAGKEPLWAALPLIFDNRNSEREAQLVARVNDGRPMILVAAEGVASPFLEREDLLNSVTEKFGAFNVIDLSKVTAERPYDLLGLFDVAKCLVTIDTMHLHLSRASDVPVVVLARDVPTEWHGSPWHKRYAFYCRYSHYPKRKAELLQAVEDVCYSRPKVATMPITALHHCGYNPSVIDAGDMRLMSYRYHPSETWKTSLSLAVIDRGNHVQGNFPIHFHPRFDYYGQEDMRLWRHNGQLMASFTFSTFKDGAPRCVMGYGKLVNKSALWSVEDVELVNYGGNDFTGMEKNWVFFSQNGKIYAVYECDKRHTVIEIQGSEVVSEHVTEGPSWAFGEMRGGTSPLPFENGWLRFFHSRTEVGHRKFVYHVGALLMSNNVPFEIQRVGSSPILSGHEWRENVHHWKPRVMIPYGAVSDGTDFLVSVGVNDAASCVARVTERQLRL